MSQSSPRAPFSPQLKAAKCIFKVLLTQEGSVIALTARTAGHRHVFYPQAQTIPLTETLQISAQRFFITNLGRRTRTRPSHTGVFGGRGRREQVQAWNIRHQDTSSSKPGPAKPFGWWWVGGGWRECFGDPPLMGEQNIRSDMSKTCFDSS